MVDRVWLEGSLRPVMLAAAEEARDSRRSVESAGAPIAFVDAAIKKLQKASDAYDRAHGQQGFKEATFKFKLKKLAKHLEDLQKKAGGA
jgi:hypothetical protein